MTQEPPPVPAGPLERALLVALWESAPEKRTARDLHALVGAERGIGYTTVTKVLDRMVTKRLVKRKKKGRSYVYEAAIKQVSVQRSIIATALRSVVGTDSRPAVAALIGAVEDVSSELLDELAAELQTLRRGDDGDGT